MSIHETTEFQFSLYRCSAVQFENNFKPRRVRISKACANANKLAESCVIGMIVHLTELSGHLPWEHRELSTRKLYDPISIYAFAQKSSPSQTRRNFHHNLHKHDVFSPLARRCSAVAHRDISILVDTFDECITRDVEISRNSICRDLFHRENVFKQSIIYRINKSRI